jgi:hypothetical protein
MTGGEISLLLLAIIAFLALSGAMYYGTTQTKEAEADPNIPTGETNPKVWHDHD